MTDTPLPFTPAGRIDEVRPFHVMELLRRARALEAAGHDIVHMEIGEPDFTTAEPVVEAGRRALAEGHTGYLPAAGLTPLREAIARHYAEEYGADVAPERIFITPGASGALTLAMALIADPGRTVLLPEPGYPCNRNFAAVVNALPRPVPVTAATDYQLTAALAADHVDADTAGILIGSPSNPTGTMADGPALEALAALADERGIALMVDEIYHGLHYTPAAASAVVHAPQALVINSFSKYFGMTGWRLGWLVVPEGLEAATEKLIQNLYINASTPAQYAALACFTPAAREIFEARREAFRERRDFLLPALRELGLAIPGEPAGAFYLYADVSAVAPDSEALARALLGEAGVAATPGLDFESAHPGRHMRFAYTTGLERLAEGVERIRRYLAAGG
ncbi:Aspartate aminotransferase [wastewater metagenome]|uniref:Aspartate aminotransferase n=3 Tax=root TaxID=1 RepID=A0A5B8R9C9_9ZZZZ|nr:pyridoxal phosphate-dependent aminotransferase [Arhodomonas aquaeolei]MCS4504003.1 pyridoxal phosphate-dependent aminotransferase [Arhodomonas aquaeolei]QEA05769.1 aspartate aminotransferase [uncultured organism]